MENQATYANLEIVVDVEPKTPFLEISGEVLLYPMMKDVKLEKAMPQGINEKEVLLNLKYIITHDAMKGVYHPFSYSERLDTRKQYETVRIVHENFDEQVFKIKFIGE